MPHIKHFSFLNVEKHLAVAKCFSVPNAKKHLVATKRSSFPNVEKYLVAAKHFLVHFRKNAWWSLGDF